MYELKILFPDLKSLKEFTERQESTYSATPEPVQDAPPNPVPDTDSRGFPWDARLHSSNKKFNRDGSWMWRRGLDKNNIPTIEAELKGAPDVPALPTNATDLKPPSDMDYNTFMTTVFSPGLAAQKFTIGQVNEILTKFNVNSLFELQKPENIHVLPSIVFELNNV